MNERNLKDLINCDSADKEKMMEAFPDYEEIIEAEVGATLSVYLGQGMLGVAIQFID